MQHFPHRSMSTPARTEYRGEKRTLPAASDIHNHLRPPTRNLLINSSSSLILLSLSLLTLNQPSTSLVNSATAALHLRSEALNRVNSSLISLSPSVLSLSTVSRAARSSLARLLSRASLCCKSLTSSSCSFLRWPSRARLSLSVRSSRACRARV